MRGRERETTHAEPAVSLTFGEPFRGACAIYFGACAPHVEKYKKFPRTLFAIRMLAKQMKGVLRRGHLGCLGLGSTQGWRSSSARNRACLSIRSFHQRIVAERACKA